MLVGCRELRRLGGHNAIIEVDSFSAIQCGSGNACYPWRLVDWIEVIQLIGASLIMFSVERMELLMALLEKGVLFNVFLDSC